MPDKFPGGCLAAVTAAALAPTFLLVVMLPSAALTGAPVVFVAAFLVAGVHALMLGLPLYGLLSMHRRPGLAAALAGGFAVGALPALVLILLLNPAPREVAGAILGGAQPLAGLELARLAEYFAMPLSLGGCGLVGGLAFWLFALRGEEV